MIAETTDCDFKEQLETKKVKDWLKTVSAFANGIGGTMYFGIADNKTVTGLADAQGDSEKISSLIKAWITPLPEFTLAAHDIEGKSVLALTVSGGDNPPYFYSKDGAMMAYVRVGNESNPATAFRLKELVMKGKNLTFDSLPTEYRLGELPFTTFEATYRKTTGKVIVPKDYVSFGMAKSDGTLTNAGVLFADDCPILQARVFCTRWNGLSKGAVGDDAIDDKEFEGDLISQLNKSHDFIKMNSKVRWKKMADHRLNKPDYADRAVFEALANALMHRNYQEVGSEVHVDMHDDRLEIYSPGGMADGTLIQEREIEEVPSTRRNPIIAEIFHRLDYVERRGSGLKKIRSETSGLHDYTDEFAPRFVSTQTAFHVVLKNINYDLHGGTTQDNTQVTTQATVQDGNQDKRFGELLDYCGIARTRDEMQQFMGLGNREHFRKSYLKPLLESGQLKMTIPDKPNSKNQRYIRA